MEDYIVDQQMTKVLLRRTFLLVFGFDFDSHLSRFEFNIDGKSLRELCSSKVTYARIKYHREEDPIDFPEQFKAGFGKTDQKDIRNAFHNIIKHESDNEMSATGLQKLSYVLKNTDQSFV